MPGGAVAHKNRSSRSSETEQAPRGYYGVDTTRTVVSDWHAIPAFPTAAEEEAFWDNHILEAQLLADVDLGEDLLLFDEE